MRDAKIGSSSQDIIFIFIFIFISISISISHDIRKKESSPDSRIRNI